MAFRNIFISFNYRPLLFGGLGGEDVVGQLQQGDQEGHQEHDQQEDEGPHWFSDFGSLGKLFSLTFRSPILMLSRSWVAGKATQALPASEASLTVGQSPLLSLLHHLSFSI